MIEGREPRRRRRTERLAGTLAPPTSARAHADALEGLEEFAFGLDAGCDDDLGFLKFADGAFADVAHAGGDGADKVLRAVVDGGGAVKNLFQRAGDADLDARAARQVCVGRRHAPMVTASGGFVGA